MKGSSLTKVHKFKLFLIVTKFLIIKTHSLKRFYKINLRHHLLPLDSLDKNENILKAQTDLILKPFFIAPDCSEQGMSTSALY